VEEFKQLWIRWNDFSGKSTVKEYWMAMLFNFGIGLILFLLGLFGAFFNWVTYIYYLAILVPSIAIAIRRMHDTKRSGWYLLWGFLPIVGTIMVIIALIEASKE